MDKLFKIIILSILLLLPVLILYGKKSKEKKEKKTTKEQINDELNKQDAKPNKQDVKPKCHNAVKNFANYDECRRCSTLKKEEDCIKDSAYIKKGSEKIITKFPCCFWK